VDYPCVLIRLSRCSRKTLGKLLLTGWTFVSSGAKLTRRKRRAR
jgi:hypothetical protein